MAQFKGRQENNSSRIYTAVYFKGLNLPSCLLNVPSARIWRKDILTMNIPTARKWLQLTISIQLGLLTTTWDSLLSFEFLFELHHFEQKSLPNIVRSPYTSKLKFQSDNVGSSSQQDSFVLDLDPVAEHEESCWNIITHFNILVLFRE